MPNDSGRVPWWSGGELQQLAPGLQFAQICESLRDLSPHAPRRPPLDTQFVPIQLNKIIHVPKRDHILLWLWMPLDRPTTF